MRDKTLECSQTKPPKRRKNDAKDQKTRWRKTEAGSVVPGKRGMGRVGTKNIWGSNSPAARYNWITRKGAEHQT